MNKKFTFKLTYDEYLEYLRYLSITNKSNIKLSWWLKFTVPFLVVVSLIFFRKFNNIIFVILGVVISVFWIFRAAPYFFTKSIENNIRKNILSRMDENSYKEISVCFNEDKIIVDKQKVDYSAILRVIPLGKVVVFQRKEGDFIVPNRVIGEKEQVQEFIVEFDKHSLK